MRVTVFNPNTFALTDAGWTDTLDSVQPGLFIASPAGITVGPTCGAATVTAVPGTATLSLSGATIPAQSGATPGQCYIEVNISSVTPGNLINTIPANNLRADGRDGGTPVVVTNTSPASATLTVTSISPPSLSKSFAPNTIFVGQTSTLTIRINNNDADTNLTGASYTDSLPADLVIATPNGLAVSNCGPGTVTAPAGGAAITLSNATVTPNQDCLVTVNISGASGAYTIASGQANTIPAGPGGRGSLRTDQGVTNATPAQAELTIQPVGITKSFAPDPIVAGGTSLLTITLQNPTLSDYTGVSISDVVDNAQPGLEVVPGMEATTCGGVLTTSVTAPGVNANTITLTDGTIPARTAPLPSVGTCTITVTVRAPLTISNVQTVRTNTIPPGALTQTPPGITNVIAAQDTLTVNPALTGAKAYSPANIPINGLSLVTVTLTNNSAIPFTDVDLTDTVPTNLSIATTGTTPAAPANPATTCSNGLAPDPAVTNTTTSVTLTNGEIAANSNCTLTFYVTGSVAGSGTTYENTIPVNGITACTALSGCVGNGSIIRTGTDLTIFSTPPPLGLTKSFQTSPIQPGQTSRLRITITAPADTSISQINLTDTLPDGLSIVSSPAPTESCPGGTLAAPAGSRVITFSNMAANLLAAGTSCNIDVWVTANAPNSYTVANNNPNRISAGTVTTLQGRTNSADATAELIVTSMTVSKAFYPAFVQTGGLSSLTITLRNTAPSALQVVTLTDPLPGSTTTGVRVAAVPNASTTCSGGTVTAAPGAATVSLTGGIIPAQVAGVPGICTITVDVQGRDSTPSSPSAQTNTIPIANVSARVQDTGNLIAPLAQAQATLTIQNLSIGIVKGFDPVLVYGGAYSTMSVQLINPNPSADLSGIAFTDNMSLLGAGIQLAEPPAFNVGTCGGTLTGSPGDTSFSFSGGVLPPSSTCTLTLRVVMAVNGNRTNRIPAGAVTTFNGVSNPDPTEASLTNLPGVSVNKSFNPAQVLTNQPATLTITIQNTSNVPVVNMGLADEFPGALPDGLQVADPANAGNTCGGVLTAVPGAQNVELTGGGLAALGAPGATCTVRVDVISTRSGVYLNTIPAGALTSDNGATNNDPATATLTVESLTFSLGNRVWFDTDNDWTMDSAEAGVDGVAVQLYAADVSGEPVGSVLGTATTAGGGFYRFDDLPPGDYVVIIPASQFDSGAPLAGYWSSGTSLTGSAASEVAAPDPDDDTDRDDNGTRRTSGALAGAVVSRAVTLGPNADEPIGDNDPATNPGAGEAPDAQSNRTVDFGFYRTQLGNLVYVDVNGTGAFDAGDTLLSGARVQLYSADGATEINVGPDGVWGTADDGSGGVVTGADGAYLFSGLPAANFIVRVTPPTGYTSTVDTASPGDVADPNANMDNNDNGVGGLSGTVSSNIITLTPGSNGALNANTVDFSTGTTADPTLDFGFLAPVVATDTPTTTPTLTPTVTSTATPTVTQIHSGTATPALTDTPTGMPTNAPTAVVQVADPALAKSVDPARAAVGETVTFTLTVTNQGNIPAPNVVVTDALPALFDVTAVKVSGAPLGTLVTVTPRIGTGIAPYTVVVAFGSVLDVTDVVTIEITTVANSLGTPPLRNTARLSTSALSDLAGNNTASVSVRIQDPARRTLPSTGFARDTITYIGEQPANLVYAPTRLTLEIPSLSLSIPIVGVPIKYGSWDVSWLGRQAGWLEGTAFPSWKGNSVITGHVYLSNGLPGPFVDLSKLRYGQQLIVHAFEQKYIYEVRSNEIVSPTDASAFQHEDKPWLTLVTCKEYDEKTDSYRKRVVIRAVLVSITSP